VRRRRCRVRLGLVRAALRPTIDQLGVSKAFAGLVIVAIAGNAVENATGVVLAHKGPADLAISVVKNSVAQIARFLFPCSCSRRCCSPRR
jgi:Ca2+:H+ antiporter